MYYYISFDTIRSIVRNTIYTVGLWLLTVYNLYILVWAEAERQTDRQTDRQTERQTLKLLLYQKENNLVVFVSKMMT